MKSIAFNLNSEVESATDFYFDDLKWEILAEPEPEPVWVNILKNGDAEGEFGKLPCARSRVNYGEDANVVVPCEIINEKGNKVFHIHAGEKGKNVWDNQFWIQSPHAFKNGDEIRISFRYKAAKTAEINTEAHAAHTNFLYWNVLGEISFDTAWEEFSRTLILTEDGVQSIAFDLSKYSEENDYYFDDIKWEYVIKDKAYEAKGLAVDFSESTPVENLVFYNTRIKKVEVGSDNTVVFNGWDGNIGNGLKIGFDGNVITSLKQIVDGKEVESEIEETKDGIVVTVYPHNPEYQKAKILLGKSSIIVDPEDEPYTGEVSLVGIFYNEDNVPEEKVYAAFWPRVIPRIFIPEGDKYFWASNEEGVVSEDGGKIESNAENCVNVLNDDFFTICLDGASDFSTNVVKINLNTQILAGDTIYITGFKNIDAANIATGVKIRFNDIDSEDLTTGDVFNNVHPDFISGTGNPNKIQIIVSESQSGCKSLELTRETENANCYITEIEIRENPIATSIKNIEDKADINCSKIYNLHGQRVGADYKGIVIRDGKKMLVK